MQQPVTALDPRRWLILAIVGVAQLMVVLDTTIVNIALPSAQHSLGFSNDSRQWIITGYALAFGGLLLLGGRLGDVFGRKRVFIIGLIGFATASAIGGLAPSFIVLVGARALQGAFGALLAPSALSLLTTTFTEPGERGKAFGVYGAIVGSGAAVGLLLGGFLTEYLSWRWCLYVNVVLAVPAAFAAIRLLRNEPASATHRIDVPGAVSSVLGLFALVYGFSSAETHGWGAAITVAALVAAVVLLVGFVVIERRVAHPLLPMRVVLDRARGGSYIAIAVVGAGMFGVFLFLTYYLQQTLHFSPVQTGLAFLPMMGTVMFTATLGSSRLVPRFGPRPLVTLGMVAAAVAMAMLTAVTVDSSYASHVLPALLLMGVGLGLVMAPAMSAATAGVDPSDAGIASAMVNTGQQVGGSVGTALLSSIAASAVTSYLVGHAHAQHLVAAAAVHGYTTAFWWAAGIFALGAVICGVLLPSHVAEVEPDTSAQPAFAH
jgi:EmrB/QacA subfamily drug resistance transporter